LIDFVRIPYLFVYALVMALVEIEIEGEHGWAAQLPTWKRTTGWAARLWGWMLHGKPLTGYHAFMLPLPLFAFHLGFVEGQPWSWPAEARALATYLLWTIEWDFLWFVFNPPFGWRRFRRGEVWWHKRWVGRMPADYVQAIVASFVLTALTDQWPAHAMLVSGFVGLSVISVRRHARLEIIAGRPRASPRSPAFNKASA
jgi:hypothetical protein